MAEQLVMANAQRNGAILSECGTYRYQLWREWGHGSEPKVAFLMLNPSTADGTEDDPTIRKCIGFAKQWSQARDGGGPFGGIVVVNLFAYRSTDPNALASLSMLTAVGVDNAHHIGRVLSSSGIGKVVCAWGSTGSAAVKRMVKERLVVVRPMLHAYGHAWCLGRSADGNPRHPLMLAYKTELEPYAQIVRPAATTQEGQSDG